MRPVHRLAGYLVSGHFWEATAENWESEFLQMAMFVLLTVSLRQKGSAQSKPIGVVEDVDLDPARFRNEPGVPGPVRRGGWRLRSTRILWDWRSPCCLSSPFVMHGVGGLQSFNEERLEHGQPPVVLSDYMGSSKFWFESCQNWQSEFLSLGAMVVGTHLPAAARLGGIEAGPRAARRDRPVTHRVTPDARR